MELVFLFQGRPVAPRLPEQPHVNIEVSGDNIEAMEKKLLDEISGRNKDGKVEVHKDAGFAENPMDREDVTENIGLEQLKSFSSILASLKAGDTLL